MVICVFATIDKNISNETYINHVQDQQYNRQPQNDLDMIFIHNDKQEPATMKMPVWNSQQMDPNNK
jgi:hypothetical protein